ncbi:hypothetical protein PV325_013346, partial [Microctonus aethiopoides]
DMNIPFILKHFFKDIKNDSDNDTNVSATCNKCAKTLKGSLNATTNFLNHLKRKGHADLLAEYEKLKSQHTSKKRKCISDADEGLISSKQMKQSTLPTILPKSVNFDRLLINFLVDTMSPISIVENESFKALIEGTQQLNVPPKIMCRRTCNKKIAEQYKEYVENTKEVLKKVDF